MALLNIFLPILLIKAVFGVVTDVPCGERLHLKVGDQFRMAKSDDAKKGECTRTFDVEKDVQMMFECTKFDIGVNSFSSPAVFQGDSQIMTETDLAHKLTGELPNKGDPVKVFHLLIENLSEFKEFECLLRGEKIDSEDNVEPLLPKCGDSARSYVVHTGNKYTIASEHFLDCPLHFTIPANVSASIHCATFNMGKGLFNSSFDFGLNEVNSTQTDSEKLIEPEVFQFHSKQLDGKVFGYLASSKEADQPERRWTIDIKKLKEKKVEYDCILHGELDGAAPAAAAA